MSVIIKPLLTEKQTKISEKYTNRAGFIVERDANKEEIKKAVEELYNVKVVKVNTLIAPATRSQRFTKAGIISGRKPSYKKAIVTLAEGQKIDFYSNI